MSITLEKTLANLPETKRGFSYNMSANGKKGERLAYTNKKSVFLRDLEDPSKSAIFAGTHKMDCSVATISPSGHWVASGDTGGRVIIWGDSNQSIKGDYPVLKAINDIAWGPESKKVCVAGTSVGYMGKVITMDSGNSVGELTQHQKTVLSCDYKQTRPYRVITGSEDCTSRLYAGPPFKPSSKETGHKNYVTKVRFAPDSEKYASVGPDRKIICNDAKTGEQIKVLESKEDGHTGSVYSFAWSPDSQKILTCGADKTAKIWDYESGAVEKTFTFSKDTKDMQMCAVWHKDFMLTVSLSGAINYLDMENVAKPKLIVQGHNEPVTCISVDEANKCFYTGDSGGVLSVWKDHTASWFEGKGHGKAITAVGVNFDGSKVATAGRDEKLRINDCKEQVFSSDAIAIGGSPSCLDCGNKTDGLVAVGLAQDKIFVLNGGVSSSTAVSEKPMSLKFNPTDDKLAVGFKKGGVKVYSVSGAELKLDYEFTEQKKEVNSVEWSPCGTMLLMGGMDKSILVHKGSDQTRLNKTSWQFHSAAVQDVAFSPDGTKVCSVASDLTLHVWTDLKEFSSDRLTQKCAHAEGILSAKFLDNETIVTVGNDACMKIWKC